jgi:hypothetical protein
MADNQVDLKLNLDFKGVNDALYQMIGDFKGTDKEFEKIAASIDKNAKKLEASIILFGPASKQAATAQKALEANMITLVANGVNPEIAALATLNTKLSQTQAATNGATGSINNSAGALKQSSKQWTSLALVVQDLPYGFRGIQNNLPALFGSIASAAGPAYFAFSALIAAITFFDQQSQKAAASTKSLYEGFHTLKTETLSLGSIFSAVREGTLSAADATKIFNEKLGDLYGTAKSVYEAEQLYIKKTEGYIKAQYFRAKADIEYEKAKEALAKKDAAYAEDQVGILGRLAIATASFFKAGAFQGIGGLYSTATLYAKESADQQIELAGYVSDYQEAQFQKSLALGERYNSQRYKIEQQYGIKSTTIKDNASKEEIAALNKAKEQQQKVNEQVLQNLIDAKKQEVQMYKDDAFAKYKASAELVQLEVDLAKEKLKNAGYTANQITALEIGIHKERDNKLVLLGEALQEQLLVQDDKTRKEKKKRDEEELKQFTDGYKNQLSAFDAFYRDKQNLSTGDRLAQKSIYEQEASDLQYMLESNFITYDDYIKRLGETFKGWSNNNKAITKEAASSIMQIGNGLMSALGSSMDMLLNKGASLGDTIKGMVNDLIQQLIKVIATAAIAAALMSVIFPGKLAEAGMGGMDLFQSLFTQGMGLGSIAFPAKKMANGGIVSGPTMGLMGEYPGAANNPEVVAPLDKLKSMIGGGSGGTFVLRGQDLLLATNRAQKASNLKGQSISLA